MAILFIFGFHQFLVDPCIFIHHEQQLIIGLYINNIPIANPHITNIIWFKKVIAQKYKIKDLGEIKKIVGIKVIRDRLNRTLHLDQEAYLEKVL